VSVHKRAYFVWMQYIRTLMSNHVDGERIASRSLM
jgi:hypothetical protein